MKITLTPTDGHRTTPNRSIEIAIPGDDWTLWDVLDELVKPTLIAWGFSKELVEEIGGTND